MQARTNTLLVLVYSAIALVVALLVFLLGSQHQKAEQLLARLNETERESQRRIVPKAETQPHRSLRPALVRLERLLDARTQMIRVQQSQLSEQISGREKLNQKYEKLSAAYDELRNEHELLLNEIQFYLSAANVVASESSTVESTEPPENTIDAEATDGAAALTEDDDLAQFAEVEATRLREELVELTASSQRDAVVAGYASQAIVEMGDAAIPLLTALLSDDQADARAWAAWVLGEMGSDAVVATADLEPLLNDNNEEVAATAAEALRRIERGR